MLLESHAFPAGTRRVLGCIAGRWAGEKALVTTAEGHLFELPAPDHLQGKFNVGDEVAVYVGASGEPRGWLLNGLGRGALLEGAQPQTR
jgi:hypothetical protein